MDKQALLEQLSYHNWATSKVLKVCQKLSMVELKQDLGGSFGSLWATLIHMFSADEIWLSRWQGDINVSFREVDAFENLEELQRAWENKQTQIQRFIQTSDTNTILDIRGYQHKIWQMALHMIDHSSFHRGQLVFMLRELMQEPPSSNFIHYLREVGNGQ